MRQIILDTETTGLEPKQGHRIVEIGCVEMVSRRLTGNNFHCYLNPERESDDAALEVHGLTTEFLSDKPKFGEVTQEFLDFVKGAEIIIHNAAFDLGFLDAELGRVKLGKFKQYCPNVIDSLAKAKELHPGKRNNLDALCERYGISNAHRKLHGALLDGELLAEVYLAMTRGQDGLGMQFDSGGSQGSGDLSDDVDLRTVPVLVLSANDDELAEHSKLLLAIDKESRGKLVWKSA